MADNQLEIILKLIDNASPEFRKANQEAIKQVNDLKNAANKGFKEASDESKKLKDSVSSVGKETEETSKKTEESNNKNIKSWTRLTLTIGSVIVAIKAVQKTITDTINVGRDMDSTFDQSFNNFEESILRVKQTLAVLLIPTLKTALDFWSEFLNKRFDGSSFSGFNDQLNQSEARLKSLKAELGGINSGNFVKNTANIEKVGKRKSEIEAEIKMEETRIQTIQKLMTAQKSQTQAQFDNNIAIKRAGNELASHIKALKEAELLFITGKDRASEYYMTVLEGQDSVIAQNQILSKDLQNLATLQAQLGNDELNRARNQIQEQIALMQFYQQTVQTAQQGIASFMVQVGQTIQTGLSGAITNLITGVKSAKEAFAEFGKAMINTIVNFIAQKVVASILEKTLLAGTVAASTAAGAAIAAAWAPAAAMTSLASFGANAGPASTGIATVSALAQTLALPRAIGGDDVVSKPTLFMAGEGNRPERVTVSPQGGRNFHGGGDINIYIGSAQMSTSTGISRTAEMLGSEIEDSLRRARSF